MKASELVRKLNAMIMQYGDKPIAERDHEYDRWYTIDMRWFIQNSMMKHGLYFADATHGTRFRKGEKIWIGFSRGDMLSQEL